MFFRMNRTKKHKEQAQPSPVFFTAEQIERMSKQEGSYQYKGDKDGKETNA